MDVQIEDYGNVPLDLHLSFQKYKLNDEQKIGIIRIWEFFERCSMLMAKEFGGDISPMKINDLRMVDYGTKDTKDGKVKTVKAIRELPSRTLEFFNYKYTDVKNAKDFFNPINMSFGIDWMLENYLINLGSFNTNEFIGEGLISHKVACNSLPWHTDSTNKVEY